MWLKKRKKKFSNAHTPVMGENAIGRPFKKDLCEEAKLHSRDFEEAKASFTKRNDSASGTPDWSCQYAK